MTIEYFDAIIEEIAGKYSRFQLIFLVCFSWLATSNFVCLNVLQSVFTAFKQNYKCAEVNGTKSSGIEPLSQCFHLYEEANQNVSLACTEWIFDESLFQSTIRSQFQLVCDREWAVSLGCTCLMAGFFFSNYVFGPISDKYGRHVCGCLSSIIGSFGAFGAALVPQYWMYCLMRGLVGVGLGGITLSASSYTVEICLARLRIHYMMIYMTAWGISGFLLITIAYFVRNHFKLQLICASFGLIYLIIPLFIPESPRWLLSRGHEDRAFEACRFIAKVNGRSLSRKRFDELSVHVHQEETLEKESLLKILTFPNLRDITLILWWCFAVASFVYYILSLGSGSLGVNIFVNMILMFTSDLLTRGLNVYAGIKFGRVPCLVVTYIGGGAFILLCGSVYQLPGLEHLVTTFSMIGRALISMAFEMIWTYGADVYPTVARSSGVGSASSFGRAASLISPQLENLVQVWAPLPFVISGILPISAGILCWIYFPETSRMPTMNYIHNTEDFLMRNKKQFCSRKSLCFEASEVDDNDIEDNEDMYENEPLTV